MTYHYLVENLVNCIDIKPKEFQLSHSLVPLGDLSHYENGELISIWLIGLK